MKPLFLFLLSAIIVQAQVNILTANGDNNRDNANLQETVLSPATVNATTFGKLAEFPVDGQVYAQPLYVSNLPVAGGTHNVLFIATLNNTVYAFDADAVAPLVTILWQVNLGPPVATSLLYNTPYGDITGDVGILGTGAIDLGRGVLYVVAEVMEGSTPAFYLHALDLATGAERLNGPVALNASVPGTGSGALADGTIPLDTMQHIQRPGLLLANNSVYVSFGSHGDQGAYHGWILSYDASDVSRQVGVYMATPKGNAGSIWQAGRGPAADEQGNIYAITGNGDNDGAANFGESFIKLAADGSVPVDWFTPSDWSSMSSNDDDISAGPALIAGTHTVIGADKGGVLYVVDGDGMSKPGGATLIAASTGSIFNFAVWSTGNGGLVYTQGGNDPLKAFQVTGTDISPDPVSTASTPDKFARIGMTLSADGTRADSGILWETVGDYSNGTPGTLHAYNASDLTIEVWNSDMNQARDQMPPISKFLSPTVANGRVFVPGFTNVVEVYGLFSPPPVTPPHHIRPDNSAAPRRVIPR